MSKLRKKVAHVMFAVVVFNLLFANESRELSVQCSVTAMHADAESRAKTLLRVASDGGKNFLAEHINKI